MLFVFLTWICRPISFFSNLSHPAFSFKPLFIVHSIQWSGGTEEYAFPINDWQFSYNKEDISIENTGNHRLYFVLSYTIIHGIINLIEEKNYLNLYFEDY